MKRREVEGNVEGLGKEGLKNVWGFNVLFEGMEMGEKAGFVIC